MRYPNRIPVTQLYGEAKHHARWRKPAEAEHAAAVAELAELAGGRADLPAGACGIRGRCERGPAAKVRPEPDR